MQIIFSGPLESLDIFKSENRKPLKPEVFCICMISIINVLEIGILVMNWLYCVRNDSRYNKVNQIGTK